jgi:hypothetical protein
MCAPGLIHADPSLIVFLRCLRPASNLARLFLEPNVTIVVGTLGPF